MAKCGRDKDSKGRLDHHATLVMTYEEAEGAVPCDDERGGKGRVPWGRKNAQKNRREDGFFGYLIVFFNYYLDFLAAFLAGLFLVAERVLQEEVFLLLKDNEVFLALANALS